MPLRPTTLPSASRGRETSSWRLKRTPRSMAQKCPQRYTAVINVTERALCVGSECFDGNGGNGERVVGCRYKSGAGFCFRLPSSDFL